jgi:ABC-type uncharacterized transport system involved in gliding motility auxiliary subunit
MKDSPKVSRKAIALFGTGAAGLVVLLVALGAVNLIVANLRLRRDCTHDRLYTLSRGSRDVLAKLDRDVVLKFYFSRSLPVVPMEVKSYARQVEDLLKEYQLAGKGRVTIETYDPQPDSDTEEWAQRYGVEPQPTGMFSPPMYFGLVAVADKDQVLPALSPRTEAMLEYEITRLITRVVTSAKPVIGVLSSLPVLGGPDPSMMMMPPQRRPPQGWAAFNEIKKDYEVRSVATDVESIDADITALVVVHPKNLPDKALYAIDQFVMRGGRLIACVDPFSAADMEASGQNQMGMFGMGGMGGGQGPSTLGRLFDAWGIGFDTQKIVADRRAVTRLGGNGRVEESPVFLSLGRGNMNAEELLTAQIDQVMLPFAGELVNKTGDDISFKPLITSSDAACLVDAMGAQFGLQAIRSQLKEDKLRHVLAARLFGKFRSAFPEGKPGAADTNAPPADAAAHLASCAAPTTVVVFGDVDFLADRYTIRSVPMMFGLEAAEPINDNLALFGNLVELATGHQDLIAIRSRGRSSRPFEKVDELEYQASAAWQAREEDLNRALEDTRRQIAELQQQKKGSQKFILSKEQQEAVNRFREREISIKQELKTVRKSLRKDIENLGTWVKVINIGLVPLVVIAFGVGRAAARRRTG